MPKIQYDRFLNEPSCKEMYVERVKYNSLNDSGNSKKNSGEICERGYPKENKIREKGVDNSGNSRDDKIKQHATTGNDADYRTLNTEIRHKCGQEKEEWLNGKSTEIERISITDEAGMDKRIEQLTGQKVYLSTVCIKSKREHFIIVKNRTNMSKNFFRWKWETCNSQHYRKTWNIKI